MDIKTNSGFRVTIQDTQRSSKSGPNFTDCVIRIEYPGSDGKFIELTLDPSGPDVGIRGNEHFHVGTEENDQIFSVDTGDFSILPDHHHTIQSYLHSYLIDGRITSFTLAKNIRVGFKVVSTNLTQIGM